MTPWGPTKGSLRRTQGMARRLGRHHASHPFWSCWHVAHPTLKRKRFFLEIQAYHKSFYIKLNSQTMNWKCPSPNSGHGVLKFKLDLIKRTNLSRGVFCTLGDYYKWFFSHFYRTSPIKTKPSTLKSKSLHSLSPKHSMMSFEAQMK